MATAQETIITGLQALRVLGMGQQPTTAQAQYCLRQLNNWINQLQGFGGSLPLQDVRVDSSYDVGTRWGAVRLMCTTGVTITLPERPIDGQRIEIVDAAETADTSNIIVARNGWLINGAAANYTISTEGANVRLMFRADKGDWQVLEDLELADPLPFPAEFDQGIALLAAETYTRFGQSLSAGDEKRARKAENKLRGRYAKPPAGQFEAAVSSIGDGARPRGTLNDFLNGIES